VTLDDLIAYCLAKPEAEETYPWGDGELVAKVGGKAFAFIGMEAASVGLKCGATADEADEWRRRHPDAITTSAYIGRYGWNRVELAGVPDADVRDLVDRSYQDIVARLPKSKRPK
jgi:predicted DNA-binding protein (MmcQ/YjbR family)